MIQGKTHQRYIRIPTNGSSYKSILRITQRCDLWKGVLPKTDASCREAARSNGFIVHNLKIR